MGAEIKANQIIHLPAGEDVTLQVNFREIAPGFSANDIILENKKGALKPKGFNDFPEGVDIVLFRGKAYSSIKAQRIIIGIDEKFVAITDDGFVRVYEGREYGFIRKTPSGGEMHYRPGNNLDTAGVAVRPTKGEWR